MKRVSAKPKSRSKKIIVTIIIAAAAVVAGVLIWKNVNQDTAKGYVSPRPEAACHAAPQNVDELGTYKVPCQVSVVMMQYGRTVDAAGDRARLEAATRGFDATISDSSLPETGIYYLDVAPGTEDKIVTHLKSQKGIVDAAQETNCVGECIGPN